MLQKLTIKNLAVIEKATVEFKTGLNVLTGETGAGKSVVIGALDLVLGSRADAAMVRDGESEARIEAEFSLGSSGRAAEGVAETLAEAGIEADEDGSLVIRRTIHSSGGGKVRINDCASTVATLRKLRQLLVDIHGPRSNQNLLDVRFQRDTLDSWADIDLSEYGEVYAKMKEARRRRDELSSGPVDEDELDILRYQIDEIEKASLTEDDESIASRHAAAAKAGEMAKTASEITETLGGDGSAAEKMASLQPRFSSMSGHLGEASAWLAETVGIISRIEELSRSVADAVSRLEIDFGEMEELDARLTLVSRLKRKYGPTVSAVLEKLAEKKRRLDDAENRASRLSRIDGEISRLEKELADAGARVSAARRSAAEGLSAAVTSELRDLGFLQAKFSVVVEPCEAEAKGMDKVTYLFEPNPGESPRPLADIASSGEIARVMLAVKRVLAGHDRVDVMVFDEIDANIGGEIGRTVGEKMLSVAGAGQVIAITHLPQSAVFGQHHLVVSKSVSAGRTRTEIFPVEGDGRVMEIARMLGGESLTSVVRKHAQELLGLSR